MDLLGRKRILVTGGTGSLGQVLVRRILKREWGTPAFVRVFSRDEGKQHAMRVRFSALGEHETGLAYRSISGEPSPLQFRVGDVRDLNSLKDAVRDCDLIVNAAALKQVPSCEYFPLEAVRTNVLGAENLVRAVVDTGRHGHCRVIGVSTDKACKPVNVMGMTKALQERIFQEGNLRSESAHFLCVRYGNVLASRGSVIPLFHHQILNGGPVTVTDASMTRFFLTLDQAVDTIMAAIAGGNRGETWVPRVASAKILDLAQALVGERKIEIKVTEIRPGEKLHEELVSEEEAGRTYDLGDYYAIRSILPEVASTRPVRVLKRAYDSGTLPMSREELEALLADTGLRDPKATEEELLR